MAVLAAGLVAAGLVSRQNRWAWDGEARRRPGVTSPAVPAWVGPAVRCLEDAGVRRFRVAGRLAADYQQLQPVVVAAWPVEVDERSPLLVVAADEVGALSCAARVLCRGEGVAVAACPL